jgi:hypothetical protein
MSKPSQSILTSILWFLACVPYIFFAIFRGGMKSDGGMEAYGEAMGGLWALLVCIITSVVIFVVGIVSCLYKMTQGQPCSAVAAATFVGALPIFLLLAEAFLRRH